MNNGGNRNSRVNIGLELYSFMPFAFKRVKAVSSKGIIDTAIVRGKLVVPSRIIRALESIAISS